MRDQRRRRVHPEALLRRQKQPPYDIDIVRFWNAIKTKRDTDRVSLNQIGATFEITTSTFTRIMYAAEGIDPGYRPNLRTFLTLCWWLDRSPDDYMVGPRDKPDYVQMTGPPKDTP